MRNRGFNHLICSDQKCDVQRLVKRATAEKICADRRGPAEDWKRPAHGLAVFNRNSTENFCETNPLWGQAEILEDVTACFSLANHRLGDALARPKGRVPAVAGTDENSRRNLVRSAPGEKIKRTQLPKWQSQENRLQRALKVTFAFCALS